MKFLYHIYALLAGVLEVFTRHGMGNLGGGKKRIFRVKKRLFFRKMGEKSVFYARYFSRISEISLLKAVSAAHQTSQQTGRS
jgi:hypothetical protein